MDQDDSDATSSSGPTGVGRRNRRRPFAADAWEPSIVAGEESTAARASAPASVDYAALPAEAEVAPVPALAPVTEPPAELPEVVAALLAGRLVLMAGPRLGHGSLTVRDLVARVARNLPAEEMRPLWPMLQSRPLSAAGFLAHRLGDRFHALIAQAVPRGRDLPDTVRLLGELPFRAIVTTRLDDLMERALVVEGQALAVYTPADGAALSRHEKTPFVLKLLGAPERPETLILSHEALQAALADDAFRSAVHALWRSRSFLFLGFEPGDLELSLITERLLAGAGASEQPHFALLPGAGPIEAHELWAGWRIRLIGGDSTDALTVALQEATMHAGRVPMDDDWQGWLALFAANPRRQGVVERLDQLASALYQRGDYDALIELYLGRVDAEPEAKGRAAVLLTLAHLLEKEVADPRGALTTLLAAYAEDPALASWAELARLSDAAGAWNGLLDELGELLPKLPVAVRVALSRRLGRWPELAKALDEQTGSGEGERAARVEAAHLYAERLEQPDTAIRRFEALLATGPNDPELLRPLAKLYAQAGRLDDERELLGRLAAVVEDQNERVALQRQLAQAWEAHPEGGERALAAWQALLDLEPDADDALNALEYGYRASGRSAALIEVLLRRAQLAPAPSHLEIYREIGRVAEADKAYDRAIEAYLQVESAVPEDAGTLEALVRLYELVSDPAAALERVARLAELQPDTRLAIPFWLRAAALASGALHDSERAEAYLKRALVVDATHLPTLFALAALYRHEGAPLRAAQLLSGAAARAEEARQRGELLARAGEIFESLADPERAIATYFDALTADPEQAEAGVRLAHLLEHRERFAELVPVLEMLTRKEAPTQLQVDRLLVLARVARTTGQPDKALRAAARAAELAPDQATARRMHAEELIAHGRFAEALGTLEHVRERLAGALSREERVLLLSDLGRCHLELGHLDVARATLAEALALDSSYRPALKLQAQLSESDPAALAAAKRALAEGAEPAERLRLLEEVGELYYKRLHDVESALTAWVAALELQPGDHHLWHKCLDAYVEARAWPEALAALEQLIECEGHDAVRAKYRHAAGVICRDELALLPQAAAHFRAALEDDPSHDRSAVALELVLIKLERWPELARLYRQRLKLLGPEAPGDHKSGERLGLWTKLGELCLRHLDEPSSGVAALEAALVFDRDNLDRHKQLAELYIQAGPDAADKAIVAHQQILRHEHNRIASYRALRRLYLATGRREQSLRCSMALEFLRHGEEEDARKVAELRGRPFTTARRILNEESWSRLAHPDEDALLSRLFALIAPAALGLNAQSRSALGLDRIQAIGPSDRRSYSKALTYVTTTLDVPAPAAYLRPEQREALLMATLIREDSAAPIFVLGAPLVGDRRNEVEQVFELGRRAALLTPERLVRLVAPHVQQVVHLLEATVALAAAADGDPTPPRPELRPVLEAFEDLVGRPQLEQATAIGRRLRAEGKANEAAARGWLQATDQTAQRVGYALVGDLETSARLTAADGRPPGTRPPTERLLDLVWSTVTEELFAVRLQLGLIEHPTE